MDLRIEFDQAERIVERIAKTGSQNFAIHDLTACDILRETAEKVKRRESLSRQEKQLLTNLLYLNAVMDQGRDPEGVRLLLIRVTNKAYRAGIRFLHEPTHFFDRPVFFAEALREEHQKVKLERAKISGIGPRYSLFDTTINSYTLHRWGTAMLCLKKLKENGRDLLSFILESPRADSVADRVRNHNDYGLGNAIGHKASRLLVKWLIHTFPVIESADSRWGPNSYEIPLDSNVGRVFMRSGLLFLFKNEEELWSSRCWIRQSDGKVNLSAQRLNHLKIPAGTQIESELRHVLATWGVKRRNLIKSLNAFVLRLNQKGIECTIGQLDDGFVHIGQKFCKNATTSCAKCPLAELCLANNKETALRTEYYCGVGAGVFFGR